MIISADSALESVRPRGASSLRAAAALGCDGLLDQTTSQSAGLALPCRAVKIVLTIGLTTQWNIESCQHWLDSALLFMKIMLSIAVWLGPLRQIDPKIRSTVLECILIWNVDIIENPEAMSHYPSENYERELDLL